MLGEMLGTETVLDSVCTGGCRQRGAVRSICSAQMSNATQNARNSCCCEHGANGICARNENVAHKNGHLASSCTGEPSLAMVYSPNQTYDNLFSTEDALEHGTLFVELNKPWKVGGCR